MSRTFTSDLKFGEDFEYVILEEIQKDFPKAYKIKVKLSEYDIYVPELDEGIEVKNDLTARNTENLFFESHGYGYRESGINITESFLWIHYDGSYLYYFTPEKIKEMLEYYKVKEKEYRFKVNNGVPTWGYLIKKVLCEDFAHEIIPFKEHKK